MPKIPMTPDNKAKSMFDFNRLSLEHGARARIALIEAAPEMQWVHILKAPQIAGGKPVYETVTDQKTHEARQVMKDDFIGRHICLGDPDVIDAKDVDVKACPVCAESQMSDAVRKPERRFAMNVVQYDLKPGSFIVADPFQIKIVVWAFTDNVFNKLIEFNQEWARSGGLQRHDLNLGPCESKKYQKFDINVAPDAEWLTSDARKKVTAEVYKNSRLEDLTIGIGRKVTREQMQEDLDRVLARYNLAHGISRHDEVGEAPAVGQMDLDSMLSLPSEEKQEPAPAPEPEPVLPELPSTTPEDDPSEVLDLNSLLDM